jgi:MinD-like ATPase involved in chromosome partitioning or flagellar assembly
MSMDQAAGLRQLLAPRQLRVLPLASTLSRDEQAALAVGIGAAFERGGLRVVILDASRGDVAANLGLQPRHDLLDLLEGGREFGEVALRSDAGTRVVPAARGIAAMEQFSDWTRMFAAFAALDDPADLVLLNCAPGDAAGACQAARGVMAPARAAGNPAHGDGEIVIAMTDHPESITGSYGLIKSSMRRHGQRRFRLLFLEPAAPSEVRALASRMALAARRFLGAELCYGGAHAGAAGHQSFSDLAAASTGWSLPEVAL